MLPKNAIVEFNARYTGCIKKVDPFEVAANSY